VNALAEVKHTQVTFGSIRSLTRPINTQIAIAREAEVLEQEAALEVFVRVQNGIELARVPQVLVFDLFENVSIRCSVLQRARDI
jgi:hypothetical protein